MFRQTTLVAALVSTLGMVSMVLAAEAPRPHKRTYPPKAHTQKIAPPKRAAVVPVSPVPMPPPASSMVRTSETPSHPGEEARVPAPQAAVPASPMTAEHQPNEAPATVMPVKIIDEAERQLYLVPGGKYTAEDITANGNLIASQKYAGFKAKHDRDPKPGDKICPITDTKANPSCTWVIGGKTYQFCCPPCIDEFVRLAKENPDKVKDPEEYVQQ
jgi:hypothetical protein